jgi:hypothetical protein
MALISNHLRRKGRLQRRLQIRSHGKRTNVFSDLATLVTMLVPATLRTPTTTTPLRAALVETTLQRQLLNPEILTVD